jgi:hypothetical protein
MDTPAKRRDLALENLYKEIKLKRNFIWDMGGWATPSSIESAKQQCKHLDSWQEQRKKEIETNYLNEIEKEKEKKKRLREKRINVIIKSLNEQTENVTISYTSSLQKWIIQNSHIPLIDLPKNIESQIKDSMIRLKNDLTIKLNKRYILNQNELDIIILPQVNYIKSELEKTFNIVYKELLEQFDNQI